jgi:methylthioribose-1-phosphate isomerase
MLSTIPSPIGWGADETIRILDQTLLPEEERYLELRTVEELAEAIRSLRVRGAPLIGIAAAMGVVLAVGRRGSGAAGQQDLAKVREACSRLGATRPTAVNLRWALDRMARRAEAAVGQGHELQAALLEEATRTAGCATGSGNWVHP